MLANGIYFLVAMGQWIMSEATLEMQTDSYDSYEFRDLICYACSGKDCPVAHYSLHVRHLIIGCQACYKEWHPDDALAKRECFSPESFTEMQHQNQSELTDQTCGLIETNSEVLNYCFCYTDYCNVAHNRTGVSWLIFLCPLLVLLMST